MKTSELIGPALDYVVAMAEGVPLWSIKVEKQRNLETGKWKAYGLSLWLSTAKTHYGTGHFLYSTNWLHGGPIIEREGIATRKHSSGNWYAMSMNDLGDAERAQWSEYTFRGGKQTGPFSYDVESRRQRFQGSTQLIAAMRCYVASKLGDEVDVPEELS